jgi:hypothetical protein
MAFFMFVLSLFWLCGGAVCWHDRAEAAWAHRQNDGLQNMHPQRWKMRVDRLRMWLDHNGDARHAIPGTPTWAGSPRERGRVRARVS